MSLQAQFAWQAQHFEAIFARASVCLSASSRCKCNGIGIPRAANLMWSKRADCKTGPTKTTLEEALARAYKQNISTRHHWKCKSHCICNANKDPHATLRRRSHSRTGARKMTCRKSSLSHVLAFPNGTASATFANAKERLRTLAVAKSKSFGHALTPRPPAFKREHFCYACGKNEGLAIRRRFQYLFLPLFISSLQKWLSRLTCAWGSLILLRSKVIPQPVSLSVSRRPRL